MERTNEQRLKYWTDSIMDQYSDALLNLGDLPDAPAALATRLMELLLEKVATAGKASGMTNEQMASDIVLLGKTLNEQPNCDAAILLRVMNDGTITSGGASRHMRSNATAEMADVAKKAIIMARGIREDLCGCPNCVAKRRANASGLFKAPKAEA